MSRADALGDRAVLLRGLDPHAAPRLATEMALHLPPGWTARAGVGSILVSAPQPDPTLEMRSADALAGALAAARHPRQPDTHLVEVRYDGPDLGQAAAALGCTARALAARHADTTWTVAALGFAPGFPYLLPDDRRFDLPRLDSPRTRVPAGAVGIAAGMSCIYPQQMPGGWLLIGHTTVPLFDPDSDEPSLLHPGDLIRFQETP